MCVQNIIVISAKLRVLGSGKRFGNTFWILLLLWRRLLQTNQTHTGPTLHVGPNHAALYRSQAALACYILFWPVWLLYIYAHVWFGSLYE